jgi:REP element-mobilizing transposase RayT
LISIYAHKEHNVGVLPCHLVCTAKYRRVILAKPVDETLREVFLELSKRYELHILEIGTDKGHVDFLIQSVEL